MKVTALIDDQLVNEVKKVSGGKNITQSIVIALQYYLDNQKIYNVIEEIDKEPLQFNDDFTAYNIRRINRDL